MATKTVTTCDYPGCDKRLTDLGGKMVLDPKGPTVIHPDSSITESAELCREHRQQLEAWWTRPERTAKKTEAAE